MDLEKNNGLKLAAVGGVLAGTALLAWFCRPKDEFGSQKSAHGPNDTWNYVYTYADSTSWTDVTPIPNSQVSMTDNLVPDTATASRAVRVDRVRVSDGHTVPIWSAEKSAQGPGIDLTQLQRVLLPWQQIAFAKRQADHPNFGSDMAEVIRVLAITPAQLQKAGQKPSNLPAGFTPPVGMVLPTDEDVAAAGQGPVSGPGDLDYDT